MVTEIPNYSKTSRTTQWLRRKCFDCNDENPSITQPLWYLDADGDGDGNPLETFETCEQPENYVSAGNDCNDNNAFISSLATEICNSYDDDCDNLIDEEDDSWDSTQV